MPTANYLANTITPLIGANMLYLFVANAFIGIFEGKLLCRWFGAAPRAVWWMIAANYLSAWAGLFAIGFFVTPHLDELLGARPIERINLVALELVLLAYGITIILEFAFVHLARAKPRGTLARSLCATLIVNAISYLFVAIFFVLFTFSLPLNASVVPISRQQHLPDGTLYWVNLNGEVMAREINSNRPDQRIGRVTFTDFIKPWQLDAQLSHDQGQAQMLARYGYTQYADRPTPADQTEPDPVVVDKLGKPNQFPADYWSQPRAFRKNVFDLRPGGARQTTITFDWYRYSLDTAVPGGPHCHLHIGLGGDEWPINQPVVLPDEHIVFEWKRQIVVFNPHTREISFLAAGTCPTFLPDQ